MKELKMFDKILKYLLIGGCLSVVGVGLLIFLGIYLFISQIHKEYEQGNNYPGAQYKYLTAMENGDSKAAIIWAKKLEQFRTCDGVFLAKAYELNSDYEKAIEQYPAQNILVRARIDYKRNNKKIAFENYCLFVLRRSVKQHDALFSKSWNVRNIALGDIRAAITMERDYHNMRLSPFLDYQDFLDFIEEEYAHLGTPSEYDEAMQLFRAVKNEIVEENLPRSGASNNRDAQRKKILAEQKQQP